MRKARALEEENARLKRIVADDAVQIDILKAEPKQSGGSLLQAAGRAAHEVVWQNAKKW